MERKEGRKEKDRKAERKKERKKDIIERKKQKANREQTYWKKDGEQNIRIYWKVWNKAEQ